MHSTFFYKQVMNDTASGNWAFIFINNIGQSVVTTVYISNQVKRV